MFRPLIYSLMFGLWAYSLNFDVQNIPAGPGMNWFHKLKFLTVINMVLQTGYYFLSLFRSLKDTFSERVGHGPHTAHPESPAYYRYSKFHAFCDSFYGCVAFPVALAVTLLFWGLYAIDRELVYPKHLDEIIPNWLNHVMHTAPLFFMLVDTLLTCHRLPPRKTGIKISIFLAILYDISILVWHEIDGVWVYPFFDVLDYIQRGIFFVFADFFLVFLYLLGDTLNRLVWGPACHPPVKSWSPQGRFYTQAGAGKRKIRKD